MSIESMWHLACSEIAYLFTECLKDLQRFLRRDDTEKRPAFFALSKTNIAKSDLVPLLSAYPDSNDVVYNSGETK